MDSSNFSNEVNRIDKWSLGEKPGPTKVDIFPTQKCNLNCRFCEFPDIDPSEYERELPKRELLEIVRKAGEMDVKTFGIIGGEPFVKGGMVNIMEGIKKYDMQGSITTNGTLLDGDMVKRIVGMEWDLLRISIDGIEETHDRLRGKEGAFSQVIETLDLFKKYDSSHPTIEINTVLNLQNYKEIPEIVELGKEEKVEGIILLPMIEFNEKSSDLKIKGERGGKIKKYLEDAKRIAEKDGIDINVDEIIEEELYCKSNETDDLIENKEVPCFVPWYSISVNAKGIATPCSQFEESFGIDLRKKDLEEIWLSDKFEGIRKMIAKKNLPETCSKCCAPLLEENKIIRKNVKNPEKLSLKYK